MKYALILLFCLVSFSLNFNTTTDSKSFVKKEVKRDTVYRSNLRITYYQLLPGQCMVTGKEDSVYLASGVKISTKNPSRYKYCAASRHLLKRFNPNAPFKYGDTIKIINNKKDILPKNDFSGSYIIHDATAAHIKNTIDILKNVNYYNSRGAYYCEVIKIK